MLSNFDFSVILAGLPFIWQGLLYSIKLTVVAMTGGIILGTFLALARMSGIAWLSKPAAIYVDTLRSIPLLMVILWFFFLIPFLIGTPMGAENSALITFTLFEAAFFCEIVRAGIGSVPRGQVGAAEALGMTYAQSMGHIVLPQAFRNMLPVLMTQVIVLFQDTSLVYAIGAKDLLKAAEVTGTNYNRPLEMYIFVAIVYFVICFSLSMLVRQLQKRIAIVR